jgi:hypothetical protein
MKTGPVMKSDFASNDAVFANFVRSKCIMQYMYCLALRWTVEDVNPRWSLFGIEGF